MIIIIIVAVDHAFNVKIADLELGIASKDENSSSNSSSKRNSQRSQQPKQRQSLNAEHTDTKVPHISTSYFCGKFFYSSSFSSSLPQLLLGSGSSSSSSSSSSGLRKKRSEPEIHILDDLLANWLAPEVRRVLAPSIVKCCLSFLHLAYFCVTLLLNLSLNHFLVCRPS